MTFMCAWMPDDETGEPCGEPAKFRSNLPLCPLHGAEMTARRLRHTGGFLSRHFGECLSVVHSPGWAYLVLLSSGFVKIGYSTNLASRLGDLHVQSGGRVQPLAAVAGGASMEAVLQHRFWSLHVVGPGERFHPSPELLAFAMAEGIHFDAQADVDTYHSWAAEREPDLVQPSAA